MANPNLEAISENTDDDLFYRDNSPMLAEEYQSGPIADSFIDSVRGQGRKNRMRAEFERIRKKYAADLRRNHPTSRRALELEQAYHMVPEEDELEDEEKNPREVLRQRLYALPGRRYSYTNGIVGGHNKVHDIKRELGRATRYTVTEGWPVIGAGTGWWFANRAYKRYAAKNLLGRLGAAYDNKWWEYLMPIKGQFRFTGDATKFAFKEGLKGLWGIARTPLLYAIGAYAAYKTIKYLLKRRKEKKLGQEEVDRLEGIRNNMALQRQMMPNQEEHALEAA